MYVHETPDPVPPDDGVVVEVGASGVCRSDWHGWQGHEPGIRLPHVPGHELAGTVLEVGKQVRRWRTRDRVTVPFVCACGACRQCRGGQYEVCANQTQPGFTHWGSFAERVALHAADLNLVAIPASMEFVTAASLGCRFSTAFRAVVAHGRVRPGEWVAVHGCGGVGLAVVQIAAAAGGRVVAVDISSAALALARDLGAETTVDPEIADVAAAVVDITEGGAHVSVDGLGQESTCQNSVRCLRPRGRHVQVGLMPAAARHPRLPMDRVIALELSLHGSHGMGAQAYPSMLGLISAGRLDPRRLVTAELGLDEAAEAIRNVGVRPGIAVITSF
jgi:alcohol dehydrogenase